jgi:hypothetical protein
MRPIQSIAALRRLHRAHWGVMAGLLMALAGWSPPATAHEDAPVLQQSVTIAPRTETRLGDQELVITYLDGKVVAFLQRYVDGVPISGAAIQLTIDFTPTDLKEIATGVYSSDPWQLSAGSNDIDVAVTVGEQKQNTTLALVIPSGTAKTAPPAVAAFVAVGAVPGFVLVIAAAVVFLGVNGLLLRRRALHGTGGKTAAS